MNVACPKEAACAHGKPYSVSPTFVLPQCDPRQTRHRSRLLAENGDKQTHFELGKRGPITFDTLFTQSHRAPRRPRIVSGVMQPAAIGTFSRQPRSYKHLVGRAGAAR